MFSFDLSGASFEMVLLVAAVSVAIAMAQGPLKSFGWMSRASRYLDLAEKFSDCQGGRAEKAAAGALRKKAAELVVSRLKSREAMGSGLLTAADALMATLYISAILAINGLMRIMAGSMSFYDVCASVAIGSLAGLVIDGGRYVIRWLCARHKASKNRVAAYARDDLDGKVERMYRELVALPVVDDLGDRDGDGAAEQHDDDGDGERDGD